MHTLASIDPADLGKLIVVTGIFAVILVSIFTRAVTRIVQSKHREETRREVAAYVAEGSISPQDAALILAAGPDDYRKRIADAVANGTVKAADAAAILNSPATPVRA